MNKYALRYGLLGAALLLLWLLIAWLSGADTDPSSYKTGEKIGYTVMVLAMSVIFFAIKASRDQQLEGSISFGRGLTIGSVTNLVASTLFGLFNVVYFRFVSPEFLPTYIAHYRSNIENSGASPEMIEQQLREFDAGQSLYLNPEFNALVMFATVFMIGLVISLLSAFVLRR